MKFQGKHSILAVAWVLLATFCQIHSENQEPKIEYKELNKLPFGQKRCPCKLGAREGMIAEEVSTVRRSQHFSLAQQEREGLSGAG